ncbi:MAG: RusA family crossover junction endodeoxyribonuclease [Bacteroidetes bacterium]|nr:RusA family crossover junction endodeoxyribonuclease [Bacteroidota bacterium]
MEAQAVGFELRHIKRLEGSQGVYGIVIFRFYDLPPSVNELYGNNKHGKGRGRYKTSKYKKWLDSVGFQIKPQITGTFPDRAEVHIYVDASKNRDGDNMIKPILDLLVSYGVLTNDTLKYVPKTTIEEYQAEDDFKLKVEITEYAG